MKQFAPVPLSVIEESIESVMGEYVLAGFRQTASDFALDIYTNVTNSIWSSDERPDPELEKEHKIYAKHNSLAEKLVKKLGTEARAWSARQWKQLKEYDSEYAKEIIGEKDSMTLEDVFDKDDLAKAYLIIINEFQGTMQALYDKAGI
jgi:hypothetical protein